MIKAVYAHAFKNIGEEALLPLLDLSEDDDPDNRRVALIGLGDIGRSAIPHLVQKLDNESDEAMKLHIIKALLSTNHPAATEHLFRRGLL